MEEFSVIIKSKLNESFDYKAESGDGASDWRAEYFQDAVQLLKDKVKELTKTEEKSKDENAIKEIHRKTKNGIITEDGAIQL